jgi:20S proteasome alpha/beta subunit
LRAGSKAKVSQSSTIVAALRFDTGVVIGADSQTSDLVGRVRWPSEKLGQIAETSLVVGFSGQVAPMEQMRAALRAKLRHSTTFKRQDRVIGLIDKALSPVYEELSQKYPDIKWDGSIWKIGVTGLAAYWAEDEPRILEIEANGLLDPHRNFRAIGSGTSTAYAAWRALGAEQLSQLQEGTALQAMWRILRVCIETEVAGVSEPVVMWVIAKDKARKIQDSEMDSLREVADRDFLFSLSNPQS